MNNKTLYMVESFIALLLLLLETRDSYYAEVVGRTLICGGAFYYVLNHWKRFKSPNVWALLMLAIGITYNPIVPIRWSNTMWVVADIITMGVFYFVSLKTPIDDVIVTRDEPKDN